MRIQEVSEQIGLTQDTLRYYEKIGLLDKIKKDTCGYRNYQKTDLQRLEFLICMRDAGVRIETLKRYIQLYKQGRATLQERKTLLSQERDILRDKQQRIQLSLDKINDKIRVCEKELKDE